MIPESQRAAFEVEVCDSRSVFTHVTVPPAETLTSPGLYALLPRFSAPIGIVTDDDALPAVGVLSGAGADDGTGDGEAGDDE
jgi:hypothetical protein